MIIHIENEYEGSDFNDLFAFDYKQTANDVLLAVMDLEECPFEAEAELLLTDDEGIHEVNRENRGIDRVTDVLSFPVFQYEKPADFNAVEADPFGNFDPDSGSLMLGDIMISVPRAAAQAKEYGHSIRREYAFLIAHSLLHLIGYDHMTDEEAEIMFAKQEHVLQNLGITREAEK